MNAKTCSFAKFIRARVMEHFVAPLTQEESDDYALDWTADSRSVIVGHHRNPDSYGLYKQSLDSQTPESLLAPMGGGWVNYGVMNPDGKWLIALLWHQQHGSSAKGNVADVVHWKGITSQGQPIQVSTSGVVLTYLDTTVIEPCSEGGDFTFRWFPGEGRFAQHGETVRAEHTYSGIDDLTRLPYVARMRLEAQVGARAVGAVYGEATLTTTDGAVRCSSGPVTFALSR